MALTSQQSLSLYGTPAYTGWGETEAMYDARAKGLTGSGGGAPVPSFNFDFVKEAEKAYGELGPYYDRLLRESQGDTTKAISRLTEDYDRGLRFKQQDTQEALLSSQRAAGEARQAQTTSELGRGISTRSAYGGEGNTALGIADTERADLEARVLANEQNINQGLSRYTEEANLQKTRGVTDYTEAQRRREAELERERRLESSNLANLRGERAYNRYSSTLI